METGASRPRSSKRVRQPDRFQPPKSGPLPPRGSEPVRQSDRFPPPGMSRRLPAAPSGTCPTVGQASEVRVETGASRPPRSKPVRQVSAAWMRRPGPAAPLRTCPTVGHVSEARMETGAFRPRRSEPVRQSDRFPPSGGGRLPTAPLRTCPTVGQVLAAWTKRAASSRVVPNVSDSPTGFGRLDEVGTSRPCLFKPVRQSDRFWLCAAGGGRLRRVLVFSSLWRGLMPEG